MRSLQGKKDLRCRRQLMLVAAILCCACFAKTPVAAAPESDTEEAVIRAHAMRVLRDALKNAEGFVKVHAAEMLMANNSFDDVRDIFEAELAGNPGPYYRIGVWRVLAKAAASDRLNRKKYVVKIVEVYKDRNAPDREHAIESLAKLGYEEGIPEIIDTARSGKGAFQAYARWVLANGGDAEDEARFAELLASEEEQVRGNVGYGLRFLPRICYSNRSTTMLARKVGVGAPAARRLSGSSTNR